jgi:hypothetical protein
MSPLQFPLSFLTTSCAGFSGCELLESGLLLPLSLLCLSSYRLCWCFGCERLESIVLRLLSILYLSSYRLCWCIGCEFGHPLFVIPSLLLRLFLRLLLFRRGQTYRLFS